MSILGQAFVELRPETAGFVNEAGKQIGGLSEKLNSPLLKFGTAMVGIGTGLTAIGVKFEDASHTIARETGATGDALKGLDESFAHVLSGTAGTFDQVGAAIGGLYQRTGLTGAALDAFAKQEVDLARITKTDVNTNIQATTDLFNKFGIAVVDQSAKLDVLFKASQQSGVGVAILADEITHFSAVAQLFGFSFDQTVALVASFDKAGIPATEATRGLTKAFAEFSKAGIPAQLGLQQLFDQMRAAPNATAAAQIAMQYFGTKAGPDLANAVRGGAIGVNALVATITNSQGGIVATTKATQSWGDKITQVKNRILVDLKPVASSLAGPGVAIAGLVQGITAFTGKSMVELSVATAKWVKDFALMGAAAARSAAETSAVAALYVADWIRMAAAAALNAAKIVVTTAITAAATIVDWIAMAATATASAIAIAAAWLISIGPIVLVAAAVAGLAYLIYRNWNTIKEVTVIVWQNVSAAVKEAWDFITGTVWGGISSVLGFFSRLPGDILHAVGNVAALLYNIGIDIVNGLINGLYAAWHFVTDAINRLVHLIPAPILHFLGIGSPSKLFYGFGQNMMEGWANGIAANAALPLGALDKATRSLGKAPGLSAPRFGGAGGSGATTINVNVNAPGATAGTVSGLREVARSEIASALSKVITRTTAGTSGF